MGTCMNVVLLCLVICPVGHYMTNHCNKNIVKTRKYIHKWCIHKLLLIYFNKFNHLAMTGQSGLSLCPLHIWIHSFYNTFWLPVTVDKLLHCFSKPDQPWYLTSSKSVENDIFYSTYSSDIQWPFTTWLLMHM